MAKRLGERRGRALLVLALMGLLLTLAVAGLVVLVLNARWSGERPRFAAGHPLESTTIVEWEPVSARALEVTVTFRDDAPPYGCSLEAFTAKDESVGYLRARPKNLEQRVMTMRLDDGTTEEVERVAVTDCDM